MITIKTKDGSIEAVNPHQIEKIFPLSGDESRINHTDGSYTITPEPFSDLEQRFYETLERVECWEVDHLINPLNVTKVFMDRNGKTVLRYKSRQEPSFSSEPFGDVAARLAI